MYVYRVYTAIGSGPNNQIGKTRRWDDDDAEDVMKKEKIKDKVKILKYKQNKKNNR